MEQSKMLIVLLDKFIDRADRYMKEADERRDWDDYHYYSGQKRVIEELKDLAGSFNK